MIAFRSLAPVICAAALVTPALAGTTTFNIDPGKSHLTISSGNVLLGGTTTYAAMAISPNGFTAELMGTVDAHVTSTSIEFLGTSLIRAQQHDSYTPGAESAPNNPQPADFAIEYPTQPTLGLDLRSILRQMVFKIQDSAAHTLSGPSGNQTFTPTGTVWTILDGVANLNTGSPPLIELPAAAPFDNTSTTHGSLVAQVNFDTLTIPVALEMVFFGDNLKITLLFTGTIVGTAITTSACAGDYDGDLDVDFEDLNLILSDFNGQYSFEDLNHVLSSFNTSCE